MAVQIQVRRDTAANWTSANPTLAQGEIGLETDTGKLKIGTGVTAWNSISYFVGNIAGTTLDAIGDVTITSVQNGDFLRYNGSASAWINDPVNLSTDTVGDYVQSLVAGTGVSLANNSGEGSTPTIAIGQAVGTSSSVQFAAVTAPLIGNASTASALQTPRTVQLSGDVSGSASFDGSANINISTVVNTASVALDELYGVSIVPPVEEYQVLQHNGTVWTNEYPDTVSYVRNADSVTLTPGMVVYIFGGNGDHATVKRADNSSDTTSSKTLGVVAATITAGNNGPVVTRGYVDSINLSTGYTEGDVLWLGKTGAFTKTKPSAPDHLVYIGVVVRATNNGIVYVACQNGYELEELHNVKINGVTDGQFLRYNSASTVWVNDTINLATDTAGDYVSSLVQGTGVTITNNSGESSTPTIAIGQAVGTSASVTFAKVETTGDVTVGGNLTVNGTTTTLNTETLAVEDNIVILNAGATGSPTLNAGIEVERGDSTNVVLRWNESTDKWQTTEDGINYYNIIDSYSIETRLNEFTWAQQVRLTTYAALPNAPTYTAGSLDEDGGYGIGATLESSSNARLVVDGSQASNNNRILVKNQADAKQNGIYTVTAQGSVSSHWILTRVDDANGSHPNQLHYGEHVDCQEGDKNSNQQFVISSFGTGTSGAHIIGTDDINFAQVSGVYSFTAGDGLVVSDNTLGVATANSGRIVVNANSIDLAEIIQSDVSGSPSLAFVKEIQRDQYGRVLGITTGDAQVTLGSNTSGNYVASLVAGTGVTLANNSGETATPTVSIGQDVSTSASVTFADVSAHLTGNVTGDVTGNADTATTLETARTISISGDVSGSVSFDGSQNVDITATIQPNSIALGTDTSGSYVASLVAGTGVSLTNNSGEGATPAVAIGQDVATSASVTFAAVTAPVVGNASTASALQTARTISLSGDVSGSVSFDGAADASITATIQPNSVALGTDTTGNYLADVTASTGVTISHTAGEGSTATFSIGQPVGTTDSPTFDTVYVGESGLRIGYDPFTGYQTMLTGYSPSALNAIAFPDASGTLALNGSIALGTDTTGNYVSGITAGSGITVNHTPGEGSSASISLNATLDNLSDVTVPSPSSGDYLKWNGTEWVNDPINLGTDTTGNYMSDLTQGTGVTITHTPGEGSNATIAIGQAVGTSASVTFANVTADIVGNVTGNATTVTNGVYTTSSINALADVDTASASPTNGQFLKWNGTNWVPDSVPTINALDDIGDVSAASPSSGDFLKWNGSAWINDPVNLGTDTTGNYMSDLTQGTGVTITHTPGEGSNATIAIGQAVGTSASVTFAKVTAPVTGNLTGNADTATALATSRTIELTGDVTGSASFNGSANASISATIAPNSVALGTDTTGNYVNDITAGTGVTVTHTPGEGSSPTVAIGQNVGTSASVTFAQVETTGSMIIGQNLYVSGSVVTQNQTSLQIDDPFIYLASSGSVAYTDFGIAGNYNDGTYRHGGIFRDSTDGKWKFFDGYTPEPTDPIDTGHASYSAAPVVAKYFESTIATGTAPFTVSSTTAVTNLNADYLDGQHGSYYAPLASPTFTGTVTLPTGTVTSGMILDGTIVNGDINASAAIAHSKLANATAGQVLLGTTTTGVVTATTISGDITITGAGVTAIGSGVIVNADINASAAIALSKLASGTSGQIVVANASGVPTYTTISGDITVDGSGVATIAANSVALGTDTTGNYVSSLVAGTGVTLSNNTGESATPTVAIGQDVGTTSNVQFANVTATGLLTVGTSSGSEGGEIQFLPAATGTTLSGNVTLDVYQNKLRIFEAGGTNRGVYIDLTSASAGVSSNLLSSAGATTLDGLSDVTAPTPSSGDFLKYNGTAWVNASGVVTTADTGTVTNTMLAGSIADTKLSTISTAGKVSNSATTATSANTASAIVARDASGNFTAGTITATAIATATTFIGTTSVALNRSSANLALTGISSVALPGSTSGTVTLQPAAAAGTTTITLPATTGTVVTTGDTGTVTSTMIADGTIVNADINASAAIALSKLASGTSGQIIVANSSGVPTWVSESGDISISDTGVTAIKSSVALSGAPTAATATAGTNTTQIATTAFTTTAVRDSLVRLYMEVM